MGPEERWEDRELWKEERRQEAPEDELTQEDIDNIKADEAYDANR